MKHILPKSRRKKQNICPFATNLRRWRLAAHLSQRELAEAIGVKTSLLRAWEAGRSRANYAHLAAIRDVTAMSVDELLGCIPMGTSARVQLKIDISGVVEDLERAASALGIAISRLKDLAYTERRAVGRKSQTVRRADSTGSRETPGKKKRSKSTKAKKKR